MCIRHCLKLAICLTTITLSASDYYSPNPANPGHDTNRPARTRTRAPVPKARPPVNLFTKTNRVPMDESFSFDAGNDYQGTYRYDTKMGKSESEWEFKKKGEKDQKASYGGVYVTDNVYHDKINHTLVEVGKMAEGGKSYIKLIECPRSYDFQFEGTPVSLIRRKDILELEVSVKDKTKTYELKPDASGMFPVLIEVKE